MGNEVHSPYLDDLNKAVTLTVLRIRDHPVPQ
jgi:hypothetical protein